MGWGFKVQWAIFTCHTVFLGGDASLLAFVQPTVRTFNLRFISIKEARQISLAILLRV
jgi:hypothetical protein